MNFHNPAQTYFRPTPRSSFHQELFNQRAYSLAGEKRLWLSVGKLLLVLLPVVLAGHLWLAHANQNLERRVRGAENVRHQCIDTQIDLVAKKTQLSSVERVRIMAAEKLSLYVPGKEQVQVF